MWFPLDTEFLFLFVPLFSTFIIFHRVVLKPWQVFTWGHRLVTPKRVVIARSLKKCGNTLLKFHRVVRLRVISVAAGVVHSTALTDDGALFFWASSDPDLRCQQVGLPFLIYNLFDRVWHQLFKVKLHKVEQMISMIG